MADQPATNPHVTFYSRAIDLLDIAELHVSFDSELAADIRKLASHARQKRSQVKPA